VTIIVQLVLVLGVAYGALTLVRGGVNAKHQAIRRLVGIAFFCFAALSIFVPDVVTQIARFLGIGRGTDLVLYGLIVLFMITQFTSAHNRRIQETNTTRLARHIAISEAEKPWQPTSNHSDRRSVRAFKHTSPLGPPPADAARTGSTAV